LAKLTVKIRGILAKIVIFWWENGRVELYNYAIIQLSNYGWMEGRGDADWRRAL
jgi:hypothetical protein